MELAKKISKILERDALIKDKEMNFYFYGDSTSCLANLFNPAFGVSFTNMRKIF